MQEKRSPLSGLICVLSVVCLALSLSSPLAAADPSTAIWDWHDLDAVRNDLSGHYRLMNDLDAATAGYIELASPTANGGRGWQPIGTDAESFTGVFNGQGYEIIGLSINLPSEERVGLFGRVGPGGTIEAVGLVDAYVTGKSYVGCLVGWNEGTVRNSYSDGSASGDLSVGGLVGVASQGIVVNCHSTASVTGDGGIGGLVGWNAGTVHNTYAIGEVIGNTSVGGLVGHSVGSTQGGTVTNSYSAGRVIGNEWSGGLVGYSFGGTVSNSFWDMEESGVSVSQGGAGKTTAEMMRITTFTDTGADGLEQPWDMSIVNAGQVDDAHVWNIVDGQSLPFLSGKPLIQHTLSISSSEGGQVTTPGQGAFIYDADIVINLEARADEGHRFTGWTGDVDTIANINTAVTTITMQDSCTIRADFQKAPPVPVNQLLIIGIVVGAAIAGLLAFLKRRSTPAPTGRRRRA